LWNLFVWALNEEKGWEFLILVYGKQHAVILKKREIQKKYMQHIFIVIANYINVIVKLLTGIIRSETTKSQIVS